VLRNVTPPIIPAVVNPLEGNFRNIVDDLYNKGFRMEKERGVNSKDVHSSDPFKGFETGAVKPDLDSDGSYIPIS